MNPNVCPLCGSEGSFRELAQRPTWQPLSLTFSEDGHLSENNYHEFDWGDDAIVSGYECRSCGWEWQTLAALERDMRIVARLDLARETFARIADQESGPVSVRAAGSADAYSLALAVFRTGGVMADETPRTDGQNRAYHARLAALASLVGREHGEVRMEALQYATQVRGATVESSTQLSTTEMGAVLSWLDQRIQSELAPAEPA